MNNAKILAGAVDLSGVSNSTTFSQFTEALDDTAYGDTYHSRIGGLEDYEASIEGYLEFGSGLVDPHVFNNLGSSVPYLFAPQGITDGEADTYFCKGLVGSFELGGSVGELASWSAELVGGDPYGAIKGTVLHPQTARTASSTGTGRVIGATSATQRVYAALFVTAASGTTPTLDVVVQSDDNAGFASPTSVITFTQATGTTAEFASAAGAITDTRYRVSYTIAGTNPSFTFVVVLGIR
jgi:hypothetical protein